MIFLTVGSSWYPFDRVISAVDMVAKDFPEEEFFLQVGNSKLELSNAKSKDFLSFPEMMEAIGNARVVISHAGAGSILLCLSLGKKPLVVPRKPEIGEAIDTHQEELCRKLASEGRVVILDDLEELGGAITKALEGAGQEETLEKREHAPLVDYLESLVAKWFPGNSS